LYQLGQLDSDRNEFFTNPRDAEARPRFRGVVAIAAALSVMAIFAGGLWFAYHQGLRHASVGAVDVPLIRADDRPTKVKPEKPGGMEVPDRDKLIYTQKRAAVEHLLPPPEKPMPRPTPPPAHPARVESNPTPAAAAATSATNAVPQPEAKPVAKNNSASAKAPTAQAAPAQGRGVRLQLGSVRSEQAAQQEWDRLKRANSDLLGSLTANPVRTDAGEKGVYYRIQTGPVAEADRICSELKQRNVGCLIAR
jgi:outer membrane biosynthesis protein TonB